MALSMLPCMVRPTLRARARWSSFIPRRIQSSIIPHKAVFVKLRDKSLVLLRQGGADHYGAIEIPQEASQILFTDRVAPFWNFCFEEVGNHQLWGIHLPQQYFQALHLPDIEGMRLRPQQTCLCNILDLGPIGQFDPNYAQSALAYLRQKGYEQGGTMTAILLGRGFDQGQFVRFIELYIPLRLKP